ncbi:pikachurin isoform X2 [Topomyia yanbarensis]|uniref:pikachurin isoform X2 n=1 Tax=Topomyia yanbarensis TaxID=2498891 RepID=UPI00273B843F|nr:pikachurin isoform X2 [Topomyia yanbarensis]
MWLFGFSLFVIICVAKCTEGDVSVEAAFQELNTTLTDENESSVEEDVLYQRGASFSAKLDMSDLHISMKTYSDEDDGEDGEGSMKPINLNAIDRELSLRKANHNWKMESAKLATNINNHRQQQKAKSAAASAVQFHDSSSSKKATPKRTKNGSVGGSNSRPIRMEIAGGSSLHMQDVDGRNRSEIKALALTAPESDLDFDARSSATVTTTSIPPGTNRWAEPENVTGIASVASSYNSTAMSASSTAERKESCTLDCGFEGICSNGDSGQSQHCLCPFGKAGHRCEEDFRVNTPRFNQHSWLAFPALRGAYKHVQLHIEFRPESFDGILLLTGERDDLTGDFMALLIHQGFVEFWFDCGSGTGRVRSEETIVLNQWNTITIYRHRWDAWLVLNQGNRVQGRSKGLFSRITFREPVFLGGFGNITGLDKKLPVSNGFTGCIRKFVSNEHDYNFLNVPLGDVSQGFDIQECVTDRCSRYPCQHGGKCLPSDDGAICLCPLGFGGDLCEMRLDLQVPSFNGSSYLRYAPLGDSCIIWFELKIIIKPLQEDGLLLYSGHHEYGDYISLCLNMGYVEFTFDLGSGPATVRSEFPLSMGQWHIIKVSRTSRLAVLKIDQLPEVMTVSPNGFWHLSLPHSLYLGGVHNIHTLPMSLRDKGSFAGCVQKVDINDRTISIISEALGGSNVENCPHACVARPCGPLAKCIPNLDSYECQCNPLNKQCNKAEELPSEVIEQRQRLLLRQHPIQSQEVELETTLAPAAAAGEESVPERTQAGDDGGEAGSGEDEYYYYEYDSGEGVVVGGKTSNENVNRVKDNGKIIALVEKNSVPLEATTQPGDDYRDNGAEASRGPDPIGQHTQTSQNGANEQDYVEDDYGDDNDDDDVSFVKDSNDENDNDKDSVWEKVDMKSSSRKKYFQKTEKSFTSDKNRKSLKSDTVKKLGGKTWQISTTTDDEAKKEESVPADARQQKTADMDYANDEYNKDYDHMGDRIPYRPDLIKKTKSEQQLRGKAIEKQPDLDADIDEILIEEMNRIMKNRNDYGEEDDPSAVGAGWNLGIGDEERRHAGARMDEDAIREQSSTNDDTDADDIDSLHDVLDFDGNENNQRRDKNTNHFQSAIKMAFNGHGRSEGSRRSNDSTDLSRSRSSSGSGGNSFGQQLKHAEEEDDVTRSIKYKNKYFRRYQGACFTGTESFFHYSDAETMRRVISYEIDLNLRFKTHSPSGLILWTGRHSALEEDDFLSLGVENGYLHLRYNLGSGEINIKYNSTKVSDGLWHRVRALRNSQDGTLKVDGGKPITRRSPGKLRQLNTDTGLYVGGLPATAFYTRQRYTSGIVGCISELILAGELRLNFDSTILGTAHNVEPGAP